jgi:hypothetical protein
VEPGAEHKVMPCDKLPHLIFRSLQKFNSPASAL